eukprot:8945538-Pyramimonas_sp.AAC.1
MRRASRRQARHAVCWHPGTGGLKRSSFTCRLLAWARAACPPASPSARRLGLAAQWAASCWS